MCNPYNSNVINTYKTERVLTIKRHFVETARSVIWSEKSRNYALFGDELNFRKLSSFICLKIGILT